MIMNEEKINEIINTKRMSLHPDNEGNFSRGLYQLIKENFTSDFEVIQIGTYEGVTALLFALTCKSIITVDPYENGYNFEQESREDLIRAEIIAIERLSSYSNVSMVKETSKNFYKMFDGKVDAIYIDGDHAEESIRFDLLYWQKKIKSGGFIALHDYGDVVVNKAIFDILGKPDEIYDDGSCIKRID